MKGIVMVAEGLAEAGYKLALEVREGRWDHVSNPNEKPATAYVPLISEGSVGQPFSRQADAWAESLILADAAMARLPAPSG